MSLSTTRMLVWITLGATLAAGGCSRSEEDVDESDSAVVAPSGKPATSASVALSDAQRGELVEKKATCPFVGAAVYLKKLDVLNTFGNPLARIADIAALGDEGGGNLGSVVLTVFARGNHHRMHGVTQDAAGRSVYTRDLTEETLPGTFSLDFPRSQGSHPGHSGILLRGSRGSYRGALDRAALDRLVATAVDENGKTKEQSGFEGAKYLRRSDVGEFIWANVSSDPESVYLFHGFSPAFLGDLVALHREPSVERIVALLGTNDLVGSSGEFGLLLTLLEQPNLEIGGQPVILVEDLNTMFVEKKLPADWNRRPRTAQRWVANTMALLLAAEGDRFRGVF